MTKPLDYNQVAPYGFLILEKIFVILFGTDDYVFRIIPLISGILLILFYLYLLKKIFNNYLPVLTGILLIVINFDIIYYTIELKPYILDALITIILAISFVKIIEKFDKNILRYSVFFSIILWFSYPATIIIAGIYTTLIVLFFTNKDFVNLKKTVFLGTIPLISLLICFLLTLKNSGQSDYMKSFWSDHFAPLPISLSAFYWYKRAFFWALNKPFNIENVYLGSFFSITGTIAIFKKDRKMFLFITFVLLYLLIASFIGRYPLYQRLLIFSVPLFYLILIYNFELFPQRIAKSILFIIFFTFFIFQPLKDSQEIIKYNISKQEIKPALKYISEKKLDGDLLAIHHSADTIFEFYKEKFNLNSIETIRKIKPMWNQADYKMALEKIKNSKRVWLLFTDFRRQENELLLGYMNLVGIKKDEQFYPGIELYLYEIRL